MDKKILQEELMKFKMIVNYDPSKTLYEQKNYMSDVNIRDDDYKSDIPVLKGLRNKKGRLLLKSNTKTPGGIPNTVASFKNGNIIDDEPANKIMYLIPSTRAGLKGLIPKSEKEKQEEPTKEDPQSVFEPFSIDFDLEDPFIFDTIKLTSKGETDYNQFLKKFVILKKTHSKHWNDYLKYLRDNGPYNLFGYASIDGNPNKRIANSNNPATKTYAPCRKSGGRARSEYNKCLSQKRANEMVSRLESDLPELKGLFIGVGKGETRKFANAGWPDKNSNREKTAPNRRFVLDNVPEFTYEIYKEIEDSKTSKSESPTPDTQVTPTKNRYGDDVKTFGPKMMSGTDGKEYIFYYGKKISPESGRIVTSKDGFITIQNRHGSEVFPSTGTNTSLRDSEIISNYKTEIGGSQELKPDGIWIPEGLTGNHVEIPFYYSRESANRILIRNDYFVSAFGTNWNSVIMSYEKGLINEEDMPEAFVTAGGVTIFSIGNSYFFKGWEDAKTPENSTVIKETEPRVVVTSIIIEGNTKMYELGMLTFQVAADIELKKSKK